MENMKEAGERSGGHGESVHASLRTVTSTTRATNALRQKPQKSEKKSAILANSGQMMDGAARASVKELTEFRELFDLIDTDRSGAISKEELGNLVKIVGIQVSGPELQLMLNESGSKNGEISFEDFLTIMTCRITAEYSKRDVQKSFELFAGKDAPPGTIKLDTLQEALTRYGEGSAGPDAIKDMLRHLHCKGNAFFNYKDYINVMMK